MQNPCDKIQETVNMTILNGFGSVGIPVIAAEYILLVASRAINKYLLHCTALDKVHLAYMPDGKIEDVINIFCLTAYTDDTHNRRCTIK